MRFIVAGGDPRVVGTKVPCAGVLGPFGATRWLWIAWLLRNSRAGRSAGACSSPHVNPTDPQPTVRPMRRVAGRSQRSLRPGPPSGLEWPSWALASPPAWSTSTPARRLRSLLRGGTHSSPVPRTTAIKTKGPGAITSSPRTACTCLPTIPRRESGSASQAGRHGSRTTSHAPITRWRSGWASCGPWARRRRNSECRRSGEATGGKLAPWSR